jgi:Uma2 family endonuclease
VSGFIFAEGFSVVIDQDADTPLTDEDRFHGILDGRRLVKILSVRDLAIANRLLFHLLDFNERTKQGRGFFGQIDDLGLQDNHQRMPEISFISYDRWPVRRRLPSVNPCRVVPDLVGMILNADSENVLIGNAISEYRKAGVRLIWLIRKDLENPGVGVFQGDPNPGKPAYFGFNEMGDILDGGDVLKGFRLPLSNIFEENG